MQIHLVKTKASICYTLFCELYNKRITELDKALDL